MAATQRRRVVVLDPGGFRLFRRPSGEPYLDPSRFDVTVLATRPGTRDGEVDRFVECDPTDVAAVLAQVPALRAAGPVDRVVALAEFTLLPAAHLREALGVPGPDVRQTTLLRDKVVMKEHFAAAGVRVPDHRRIAGADDVRRLVHRHGRAVVKPVDSAGSRGFRLVDAASDLDALARADGWSGGGFEAEEFIAGRIFHVDSLVRRGVVLATSASEYLDSNNTFEIGGRCRSSELEPGPDNAALLAANDRVVRALPWFDGVTHLELFLDAAGEPVFLEVAGRAGGGGIVPAFRHRFGVDLRWASIAAQVGEPGPEADPRAPGADSLTGEATIYAPVAGPLPELGTVRERPWLLHLRLTRRTGEVLGRPTAYADGIAVVTVSGPTRAVVADRLDLVQRELTGHLVPEPVGAATGGPR